MCQGKGGQPLRLDAVDKDHQPAFILWLIEAATRLTLQTTNNHAEMTTHLLSLQLRGTIPANWTLPSGLGFLSLTSNHVSAGGDARGASQTLCCLLAD